MEWTVIIPVQRHPSLVESCLKALVKNSHYKHEYLLSGSFLDTPACDFVYDAETLNRVQKYENMLDYLKANSDWLREHNVIIKDSTEKCKVLREHKLKVGEDYLSGTDAALCMNEALKWASNEVCCGIFDDDLYPASNWDYNIARHMNEFSLDKYVFVPSHIQPLYFKDLPKWDSATVWGGRWEGDVFIPLSEGEPNWRSQVSIHRLTYPWREPDTYTLEKDFLDFVEKIKQPNKVYIEGCGERLFGHWIPLVFSKDAAYQVGGWSTSQERCRSPDIGFDDDLGKVGYKKVVVCDSFIFHKGQVILEAT